MFGLSNNFHNLKNFTDFTYYGVSIHNKLFTLVPDECNNDSMHGFIYTEMVYNAFGSMSFQGQSEYDCKMYMAPFINNPIYISELGILIFCNEEERKKAIETHGTGELLVESYASRMLPLMNGAYKVTVALTKKPYYTVVNKEIHELPQATDDYIQECMIKHGISKESLEGTDMFIIETVLRHTLKGKPNVIAHEIKTIKRDKINERDPIIFTNSGIIIFTNRRACETFIEKYNGELEKYLIDKAFEKVEDSHQKELEEYVSQTKEDKRNIVETFMIMGGTSLASLIVENIIKVIVDKSKEKKETKEDSKEVSKMFTDIVPNKNIIIAGTVGIAVTATVIGGVILYKKYKNRNKRS